MGGPTQLPTHLVGQAAPLILAAAPLLLLAALEPSLEEVPVVT